MFCTGKRNKKTLGIYILVIAILITGCKSRMEISAIQETGKTTKLEARKKVSTEQSKIVATSGEVMYEFDGKVLKANEINGIVTMTYQGEGQISRVEKCGKNVLIQSGNWLKCFNKNGTVIWSDAFEGNLLEIYTDEKGNTLLEFNDGNGTYVVIVNSEGKRLEKLSVDKAFVLDFFEKDNDYIIGLIDISAEIIKSKIIAVNKKSEIVWAYNMDNKIITSIYPGDKDNIIISDEDTIYKCRVNKTTKVDFKATQGDIEAFHVANKRLAAITMSKGNYMLKIYDMDLNLETDINIGYKPNLVRMSDSYAAVVNGERAYIYDMKGNQKYIHQCISEIKDVEFTKEDTVMISTGTTFDKVLIK